MFKIDFQDGGHGGYPGIPIEISLELFRLQVTPILLLENFIGRPKKRILRSSIHVHLSRSNRKVRMTNRNQVTLKVHFRNKKSSVDIFSVA